MNIAFQKIHLSKPIKFTRHARNRMCWRKISQQEIEIALKNPDRVNRIDDKFSCFKYIQDKNIKVIFVIENDQIVVISAFDKSD